MADVRLIAQKLCEPLTTYDWIRGSYNHAQARQPLLYKDLINSYFEALKEFTGELDASQESAHAFLQGLKLRLDTLRKAHLDTSPNTKTPRAVFKGQQATLRHCQLFGDSDDAVESRLTAILNGTQLSPFVEKKDLHPLSQRQAIEKERARIEFHTLFRKPPLPSREVALKVARLGEKNTDSKTCPAFGNWMEWAQTFNGNPYHVSAVDFGCYPPETWRGDASHLLLEAALSDFSQINFREMTLEAALDWMGKILSIYADAHRDNDPEGIIFRDIKPDNLLIFPGHVIKACDFGLALYVGDNALFQGLEGRAGTPGYIPPEALVEGDFNPEFQWSYRGDVYSLGVLFFRAWTVFFDDLNEPQNIVQLQSLIDQFVAHPEQFPAIPKPLQPFLQQCLTRDISTAPTSRYISIAYAKQAFQRVEI